MSANLKNNSNEGNENIRIYAYSNCSASFDMSQENWIYLINKYTSGTENNLILDIGCGAGQLAIELSESAFQSIGIDTSLRFKNNQKFSEKCIFIRADGHKLPFKDNTFDLIVTVGTLEHANDYKLCIQEMKRVLRKSSYMFIMMGPTRIWRFLDKREHRKITTQNPNVKDTLKLLDDGDYTKVWAENVQYRLTKMDDHNIRLGSIWLEKLLHNYLIKRICISFCTLLEKNNLEQNICIVYKKTND